VEPFIDHVVVDVQERIDEAARRYAALGFTLTERGRHSLGSVNHLAMFGTDYLELLGSGEPGRPPRADVMGFPVGLNGLVFKATGAAALHAALEQRGVPVQPVQSFGRPVQIAGAREEARFHTVRLPPRAMFDGRVYYCEHLTPQFVWRPEWQQHPNGALAIARIVISAGDPGRVSAWFPRLLERKVRREGAGTETLTLGSTRIDVVTPAILARELGEWVPDPAGRSDYMALLGLKVRSMSKTGAALRAGGIAGFRKEARRILVHPAETMNVVLDFSE
jgi:hypothetical protein